jgi:hypothetical protein
VAMTHSRQADDTLNGCRVAPALSVTHEVSFMVTDICFTQVHDMFPSNNRVRHNWIPPPERYGRSPGSTSWFKPIMTTAYIHATPRTDFKPGIVLRVLKTVERTTRAPTHLWWPHEGEIAHAAYGAHI